MLHGLSPDSNRVLWFGTMLIALTGCMGLPGCSGRATSGALPAQAESERGDKAYRSAMQAVLEQDSEFGRVRNHAPESGTPAAAIRGYVANLDRIDFSGCPRAFTRAFRQHRDAWEATLPLLDQFDELRGELHEVFEVIRARDAETRAALEQVEQPIWSTWGDVEAAVTQYATGDG